jgi:hypothetical protein
MIEFASLVLYGRFEATKFDILNINIPKIGVYRSIDYIECPKIYGNYEI